VAESLKIPEICWKNGGELSDRWPVYNTVRCGNPPDDQISPLKPSDIEEEPGGTSLRVVVRELGERSRPSGTRIWYGFD
jgi:hypothetical protein